jgi:hypothetical protein
MSEREDNAQYQKLKTKMLAIVSLLVCILGVTIVVIRIVFYRPWWSEYIARNTVGLLGIIGLVLGFISLRKISKRLATTTLVVVFCSFFLLIFSLFLPILSHFISIKSSAVRQFLLMCSFTLSIVFLLGLFAIPKIIEWKTKPKEKFKGSNLAVLGAVLGVILADCWFVETCGPVSTAMSMACGINLRQLGKAMLIYANDNRGRYPEADL